MDTYDKRTGLLVECLDWRDILDRDAERAKRETKAAAEFARRSLGQRIRYARERVREVCRA